MGSGSSVPKKFEAEVVDQEGEDEPVDVEAEIPAPEDPDDPPPFPKKLFKGFLRGKVSRGKMKKVLVHYAKLLQERDPDNEVVAWKEALPEVRRIVRPSEPIDYARASGILKDSFNMEDPEGILKCAFSCSCGEPGLVYAVLRALPADSLAVLKDGRFYVESVLPYGAEDFGAAWKLELFQELLPKCKASLLEALEDEDDNGNPGAIIFEFAESQAVFPTAMLLEVAKERKDLYKDQLTDAEVAKFQSLYLRSKEHLPLFPLHQEMCIAICQGDAAGVQAMLDKKADPNMDNVDGDSSTVSPLVLALRSRWEPRWARHVLPLDLGYDFEPAVQNNMEVIKALMSAPGADVNAGAYSYGWHGSHVRLTVLGMAIISEIDTGCSRHSILSDTYLPMPRHELLQFLVKDPRTDLEESYFEAYEGGGAVGCGALMLLELETKDIEVDYRSAMVLMQAGALMTKKWVEKLQNIEDHIAKVETAIPEMEEEEAEEQRAPEPDPDEAEEKEEAEEDAPPAKEEEEEEAEPSEYEKREDGSLLWKGITFLPQEKMRETKMKKSELLKQRLEGLKEVKTWSETVKCGSNVFNTPAAFPPNFCRVAAALHRGLKGRLGKRCVGQILDFVNFFEFNRRRPLSPLKWHQRVNMFGRPLAEVTMELETLTRRIRDEPLEDRQKPLAAGHASDTLKETKGAETCWAELYRKGGWDSEDNEEQGEGAVGDEE